MTAPILLAVAGLMRERGREPGEGSADNSGEGPASPPPAPETVVCSGLLPGELDEVAAAFGACRAWGRPTAARTATGPRFCSVAAEI